MAAGYRRIARVAKAHGTHGEVVAVSVDGLPAVLKPGLRVCAVPPRLRGDRWHVVEDVETSDAGQLVTLSGVESLGEARELVGSWLLAAEADLPEGLAAHDARGLRGREVRDARLGLVGTIEDVLYGPANDVWVVRGRAGETLVPVVDAIVGRVDYGGGPIRVDLPVGLVPGDEGRGAR